MKIGVFVSISGFTFPPPAPAIGEIVAKRSAMRGPSAQVPKPPIECPVRWMRSTSTW